MGEPSVFASVPILLVGFAQGLGWPREEILAVGGLTEGDLADPDEMVPYECLIRIWSALLERHPTEPLALWYVRLWSLDALGVVGYSLRHAENGHAALALTTRLSRLADPFLRFSIERRGEDLRVVLDHEPRVLDMVEPLEMLVLATVRSAMSLVRAEVRPTEVAFRHARRHPVALYAELLGADVPLRFGADYDGCTFAAALLDLPLADADPRMASYLAQHAEVLLDKTRGRPDADPAAPVAERARYAIRESLGHGEVTLEDIAKRLAVSVRTLQRTLQEAGTSLTHEVDEARRERALILLRRPELTIAEIAFLLGYAEARVFHRSFRRWTGLTPTEFRRAK